MALQWLSDHFTTSINALGIIAGLFFTGFSLRSDAKARRVGNQLTLTEHHRDLWKLLFERPKLAQVLSDDRDLVTHPVTQEEEIFVDLLILHLNTLFKAAKEGMLKMPEGAATDLRILFSKPVFSEVWNKIKPLQDTDFIKFLDGIRADRCQSTFHD